MTGPPTTRSAAVTARRRGPTPSREPASVRTRSKERAVTAVARPTAQVVDMPGWRPITRHVLTMIAMVSLLPMAVFYATMTLFGLRTAALVTVSVYYAGLLLKKLRGRP